MGKPVAEQIHGYKTVISAITADLKAEKISKSEAFRRLHAVRNKNGEPAFTYHAIAAICSKALGVRVRDQFVHNVLGPVNG